MPDQGEGQCWGRSGRGGKRISTVRLGPGWDVGLLHPRSTGSSLPPQKVGVGPLFPQSPNPQIPRAPASHPSLNRASLGFPEKSLLHFETTLEQPTSDAPDLHVFPSHTPASLHIPKGAVPTE